METEILAFYRRWESLYYAFGLESYRGRFGESDISIESDSYTGHFFIHIYNWERDEEFEFQAKDGPGILEKLKLYYRVESKIPTLNVTKKALEKVDGGEK